MNFFTLFFCQHIFTAIKVLSGGVSLKHTQHRITFIVIVKCPWFFFMLLHCFLSIQMYTLFRNKYKQKIQLSEISAKVSQFG